jgi:energy-coupling factor transporter ATP-binding protein EcfA2
VEAISSSSTPVIYTDGEKIPSAVLQQIFRQPPDVPTSFSRSTLLVGGRGSGKTTLFRHHQAAHQGMAITLQLQSVLSSIGKKTYLGPHEFDLHPDVAPLVAGMATTLLALAITERVLEFGNVPDRTYLFDCLPARWRDRKATIDRALIHSLWKRAVLAEDADFSNLADLTPLVHLVEDIANRSVERHGPLLLVLDKTDMISGPALQPGFSLMDQTANLTTLLAMRPGLVGHASLPGLPVVPSDHYNVVNLGLRPWSEEWAEFVEAVVEAQPVRGALARASKEMRGTILALARDSVRSVLELYAWQTPNAEPDAWLTAAEHLRERELGAADAHLRHVHSDFQGLIKKVRQQVVKRHGAVPGPVVLEIRPGSKEPFPAAVTSLDHFVNLALRARGFLMPEGRPWQPGLTPRAVELPPLWLWKSREPFWSHGEGTQVTMSLSEGDLLPSTRTPHRFDVFVAYRMQEPTSIWFREQVEELAQREPGGHHVRFIDGRVHAGTRDWAAVIRGRIKRARTAVADVTGLRNDVIFEMGFARALNVHVIPVVAGRDEMDHLPHWLTQTQVGHYGEPGALEAVVEAVFARLRNQHDDIGSPQPRPTPVPNVMAWLRPLPWSDHVRERTRAAMQREGLPLEVHALPGEPGGRPPGAEARINREVMRCSLLIASLDGTEHDAFVHYVCGGIAALPWAGFGNRRLARQVLLVEEPGFGRNRYAADSLRRCADLVQLVELGEVADAALEFVKEYKKWKE